MMFRQKLKMDGFSTNWRFQFRGPKLTFEVISKTKRISKHILDYSWVIPTRFPHIKTWFSIQNVEHRSKCEKQRWESSKNPCLGSPAGVIFKFSKTFLLRLPLGFNKKNCKPALPRVFGILSGTGIAGAALALALALPFAFLDWGFIDVF